MAVDPALEADIDRDPDDPDSYFVYGDWLQQHDDPRGELIALHGAALRDPDDKKLARAVAKYLETHAGALLGELAAVDDKALDLAWHLGFVRDVRIDAGRVVARDMLAQVLAHPSGRFVQSISITGPADGTDARAIVALLLEQKRPAALSDLRVGSWDLDDEPDGGAAMRAAFPRLQRSLDQAWRAIVDAIDEHGRLDIKFDPTKFPRLVPLPGVDGRVIDGRRVLLGLRVELDKKRTLGLVPALKRTYTAESLDRFAVELGEQFRTLGETTALRWGFLAMGLLGGNETADAIATRAAGWSHARGIQAAELLASIGTGLALWELYGMVTDPGMYWSQRFEFANILETVGRQRGLGIDRLLDRSLPASISGEALTRVRAAAVRRLIAHMVDGRRIVEREFTRYVAGHPLIAPLAQRLVWATYTGKRVDRTFRLTTDNRAVDADGAAVDLAGTAIGLVHPAELDADERAEIIEAWREAFAAAKKLQPLFPQLERPVFELRDQEKGSSITRFKLRSCNFNRMREVFENERDWFVADRHEHNEIASWGRDYPRDNVRALAVVGTARIDVVNIERDGKPVKLATLHPVTLSEILGDVDAATAAPVAQDLTSAAGVTKGARVAIRSGQERGTKGIVFWLGDRGDGPRCGIRDDDGETHWASVRDVIVLQDKTPDAPAPAAPAKPSAPAKPAKPAKKTKAKASAAPAPEPPPTDGPALEKGMKVRWAKGRNSGTGVVFWLGENKFGPGIRAGVKDDETGETVWADGKDCAPIA